MSELKELFSSYPLTELILIIVGVLTVGKALWTLVEFWLQKIDIHVGERYRKQEHWNNFNQKLDGLAQNLDAHINNVSEKIDTLKKQNDQTHEHQEQLDRTLSLVQERLQENARGYLLDAHHKFCYEIKQIDDLSLQSIERRYLYYKTAGGDTFIDHLMEEIRELPRLNYYNDPKKNVVS